MSPKRCSRHSTWWRLPHVAVEQTIRCDHCGQVITQDRTALQVTTGPRRHDDLVDLCKPCFEAFTTWLGAGASISAPAVPRI